MRAGADIQFAPHVPLGAALRLAGGVSMACTALGACSAEVMPVDEVKSTTPVRSAELPICEVIPPGGERLILFHKPLTDFNASQLAIAENGCVQQVIFQPTTLTVQRLAYGDIGAAAAAELQDSWREAAESSNDVSSNEGAFEDDIRTVQQYGEAMTNSGPRAIRTDTEIQTADAILAQFRETDDWAESASWSVRCEIVSPAREAAIDPDMNIGEDNPEPLTQAETQSCAAQPGLFIILGAADISTISEGFFRTRDQQLVQYSIFRPDRTAG